MEDKINELKKLIDSLEEDSPLRKQLEKTLNEELKRLAEEKAKTDDKDEMTNPASSMPGILDGIGEKIGELLENETFVAASAGFLLGAATVFLGSRLFRC